MPIKRSVQAMRPELKFFSLRYILSWNQPHTGSLDMGIQDMDIQGSEIQDMGMGTTDIQGRDMTGIPDMDNSATVSVSAILPALASAI